MGHEVDDPLGDPLDRDLAALLAAEPSAEFVARVRTRVAQEPAPSSWRWSLGRRSLGEGGWGFALAGAAGAVVLAVLVTSWTTRVTPTALPQQAVAAQDVSLEAEHSLVPLKPDTTKEIAGRDVRSVRLQALRDVRGGRLEPARPDAPPFTEVLFSDEERRALLKLVAAVEEGRVPPFPVAPAVGEGVVPEGIAMMIEPLVIDPLPQIARLEE